MATNDFERDAVRSIQQYLRHLSFHNEEINAVPIDGIWEEETRKALIAFQQMQGLPVTGTVDRATWDILKAQYEESIAQNSPPAMLGLFPRQPRDYKMTLGEKSFLVDTVQYLIMELERLYHFPAYTATGVYDAATANLIKEFQRRNGISVTGDVDRETWDALAVQHNLLLDYEE